MRTLAIGLGAVAMCAVVAPGAAATGSSDSTPDLATFLEGFVKTDQGQALQELFLPTSADGKPVRLPVGQTQDGRGDQFSYDGNTATDASGAPDILGVTSLWLQPGPEIAPTWLRDTFADDPTLIVPTYESAVDLGALDDPMVFIVRFAEPFPDTVAAGATRTAIIGPTPRWPTAPVNPALPASPLAGATDAFRLELTPDGRELQFFGWTGRGYAEYRADLLAVHRPGSDVVSFLVDHDDLRMSEWTAIADTDDGAGSVAVGDRVGQPGTFLPLGEPVLLAPPDPGEPQDAATATTPSSDPGGGSTWLVFVVGGTVIVTGVGTGMYMRSRHRQVATTGGGLLTFAEEPSTAREDRDHVAIATWRATVFREEEIQARLLHGYERVATDVAQEVARLVAAEDRFHDTYRGLLIHSDTMQASATDWMAGKKWAGRVDLLVGVGQMGGALVKGGRWLLCGERFADDAVEAIARQAEAIDDVMIAPMRGSPAWHAADDLIRSDARLADLFSEASEHGFRVGAKLVYPMADGTIGAYGYGDVLREAVMLGQEAGVGVDDLLARAATLRKQSGLTDGLDTLWWEMAERAAGARGWVKADEATELVLNKAIVNTNGFLTGKVVDAGELARTLDELRAVAGQHDDLAGWASQLYGTVGGEFGRDVSFAKTFNAQQVEFLGWLTEKVRQGASLDEIKAAWEGGLGPIGAAGASAALGGARAVIGGMDGTLDAAPTSLFDIDATTRQFGILDPSLLGTGWLHAGDSLPLTITLNAVNAALSPTEWFTSAFATVDALDRYQLLLEGNADDFVILSGAAVDQLGAVDRLYDIASLNQGFLLDDRTALRDLLADYESAYNDGSQEFRSDHRAELDARRAHIEQKLAQLDTASAAFVEAQPVLGQIRDGMTGAVRGERDARQWADPNLAAGLADTRAVAEGFAAQVLGTMTPTTPTFSTR